MILYMIDTDGRVRIAQFVSDEINRQGLTAAGVGAKPGRPRLATIKRIKAADPDVSEGMLAALGHKLGLPRDFLIYVGSGDAERIKASGADPDLVRWTLDLIAAGRSRFTSTRDDREVGGN